MKDKESKKNDSCTELKNIKYQNMLLSNSKILENPVTNISNIDHFLNQEIQLNKKLPWNKLGKTTKINILKNFTNEYAKKNKLSDKHKEKLNEYLLSCIERKKLQKIKDIHYDIENKKIISIPLLFFNKNTEKFILKRSDKKNKISNHLAPKNSKKRIARMKRTLKNAKEDKKTSGKTIKSLKPKKNTNKPKKPSDKSKKPSDKSKKPSNKPKKQSDKSKKPSNKPKKSSDKSKKSDKIKKK